MVGAYGFGWLRAGMRAFPVRQLGQQPGRAPDALGRVLVHNMERASARRKMPSKIFIKKVELFLAVCVASALNLLWTGYVISAIWGWFFIPKGFSSISPIEGTALAIIVQVLTRPNTNQLPDWQRFAYMFGVPLVGLIMGRVLLAATQSLGL